MSRPVVNLRRPAIVTGPDPARPFTPEQELAIAVIRCAVEDLSDRQAVRRDRARAFLAGSGLIFWADLAGIGPDVIRAELARRRPVDSHDQVVDRDDTRFSR